MPYAQKPAKALILEDLRLQIQRLEGFKNETGDAVRTGVPKIDSHLPCGALPQGTTHEFISETPEAAAATTGFLSVLLSLIAGHSGIVVWITRKKTIYAPGLISYGLKAGQIVFVEAAQDRDALWAMEEALRCKSLSAVVSDIGDADLTATRRLQLAAESSNVTGFLLRHSPKKQHNSACVTRWRIKPAPGIMQNGLPGIGAESWHVMLERVRGGKPGEWPVVWRNGTLKLITPQQEEEHVLKTAVAR